MMNDKHAKTGKKTADYRPGRGGGGGGVREEFRGGDVLLGPRNP